MKFIFVAIYLCYINYSQAQNNPQQDPSYNIENLKQQLLSTQDGLQKDTILQELISSYIWYKPDSALFYAQQKILLAKKINLPELEAFSTGYYGYILGLLGNYSQAINFLLQGLRLAQNIKDNSKLDFFYDALSDTYTEHGDFEQALLYANKFKNISVDKTDTLLYGWLLTKGVVYERFNKLDSALLYIQKVYDFEMRQFGEITRGRTLLTLGNIYLKEGIYEPAMRYYRMAVDKSAGIDHNINLIEAYNGMSQLFMKMGQIDSSILYAKEALSLSQSTFYALGELNSYNILSKIYKEQGNRDSTIKYLEIATAIKDSLFNRQSEREIQNIAFNEQLRQREVIAAQQQYQNKIRVYGLVLGLIVMFVLAAILYRNNLTKQKSFTLLQKQKEETDLQKNKVEGALEELKTAQTLLIQQEKMASLGELTAGIAHEIQNPLNFVNNFSEVNVEITTELKEEINKINIPAKEKENMQSAIEDLIQNQQKITQHGKRADGIVKGMLQHSRKSNGQKVPTDINALADEYLRVSYHGFRVKDKSFDAILKTQFDSSIQKILVVPQDLGKVLLNLYNNAFYYVTEKKKKLNGTYEPTVLVSSSKSDGKIEISVWDNGTGIPKQILDKIYQPFFTTKPTGDGTGLGLSLSYDIITNGHGGEIKVKTKEGEFSEFTLLLPL